jgi:hypothetical protein
MIWPSKQLLKSGPLYNKAKHLSKRPKGTDEQTWREIVRLFKYDKLIVLNKVPKMSQKRAPKSNDR